jgi:hypothetical protein
MDINLINTDVAPVDLEKWAQMTIEKWEFQIATRGLVGTGDLLKSFEYSISGDANGNASLITFAFNYYLRMLEMSVSKGNPFGTKKQRAGLWTRPFMHEVHRLSELMAIMYANRGAEAIVTDFGNGLMGKF